MTKISRREFMRQSTVLAAATPFINIGVPKQLPPIGLQLWSIREDMKKDALGSLKTIAKQGYKYVEGFGFDPKQGTWFGLTPKDLKKALKDLGMTMPSGHHVLTPKDYNSATKSFTDDFKKSVDAAVEVGQRYLINPWMLEADRNQEGVKNLCEIFNKAGEYCKQKGLRFGYHNHEFEFQKFASGETMYDFMLHNTDPKLVTMQMDMGWVGAAGYNPLDWFKLYPGRFELSHLKDIKVWHENPSTILGTGAMDFKSIIAHQKEAGLKMLIIELEHYQKSPLGDVGICIKNLKKILST